MSEKIQQVTDESHRIDIPTVQGLLAYLNYQYPATIGNIPLTEFCATLLTMQKERDDLHRQRDLACRLLTGESIMTDAEMQAAGLGAGTNIEQRHTVYQLQSRIAKLENKTLAVAEIVRRLPALVKECPENAATVITNILRE